MSAILPLGILSKNGWTTKSRVTSPLPLVEGGLELKESVSHRNPSRFYSGRVLCMTVNTTSALDKTFKNIWRSATRIKGGMGGKKMKRGGRAIRRYNEKLQKSINWGNRECSWERGEEKSRKSRVQESDAQTEALRASVM